jgi:hypothetical protein
METSILIIIIIIGYCCCFLLSSSVYFFTKSSYFTSTPTETQVPIQQSTQTQVPIQQSIQAPTTTPNIPLYAFTEHMFTNCEARGREGPTLEKAKLEYNLDWSQDTKFFNMTVQGIQEWTVPITGNYKILAAGASGASTDNKGGEGAILEVTTKLNKGEKIKILVGQSGLSNGWGGGGGGGTFVVRDIKTPIIVAGGGGGCDYNNSGSLNPTIKATINTSGQKGGDGESQNPGLGGIGGSGGKKGNGDGAGGGLLSNGQGEGGGLGFVNGGVGGKGTGQGNGGGGGFGGGGVIFNYCGGGGGGGGYSGGGGGGSYGGGGGGGSYSIESKFDKPIAYHRGTGYVIITAIK